MVPFPSSAVVVVVCCCLRHAVVFDSSPIAVRASLLSASVSTAGHLLKLKLSLPLSLPLSFCLSLFLSFSSHSPPPLRTVSLSVKCVQQVDKMLVKIEKLSPYLPAPSPGGKSGLITRFKYCDWFVVCGGPWVARRCGVVWCDPFRCVAPRAIRSTGCLRRHCGLFFFFCSSTAEYHSINSCPSCLGLVRGLEPKLSALRDRPP